MNECEGEYTDPVFNQQPTDGYSGLLAETIDIEGLRSYYSRPLKSDPHPGLILIPHMPGWDELNREVARRFSEHGFAVVCPDIYQEFGVGAPFEVAMRAREAGGVADATVMDQTATALSFLLAQPESNGQVGVIGMCSGGRHAFMAACQVPGIDAVVDCWGGDVVMEPADLTPAMPVAPIDLTPQLQCPLLGIFGNDDTFPTPAQVDQLEAALKQHGKQYEFHRYDGAGHAIWNYTRTAYRPEAAMDSWNKALEFFSNHLRS